MNRILIHEVGLRDGLQSVSEIIPTEQKKLWAEKLIGSGLDFVQLGSFVNPKKMPQMADTESLFEYFSGKTYKTTLSGLILNERGFERAMACGVNMICMGVSASETHSMKNTGMVINDALSSIINVANKARDEGKKIQCSVQSAFGCGFEGRIDESRVLSIVEKYFDAGIKNISLADTAGHANPAQVKKFYRQLKQMEPQSVLACHFHNTYGMGMANCVAALESGAEIIETAFGGLGGCPFTKSPSGNVATEDFVHMLQEMGFRNDIDLYGIINIAEEASEIFKRELQGYVYKIGAIRDLR